LPSDDPKKTPTVADYMISKDKEIVKFSTNFVVAG